MSGYIYDSDGNLYNLKDVELATVKSTECAIGTLYKAIQKRPYWILHLDCGRKYFSVANIKSMIDAMHTNGMNQLQLHFSENNGFRFALDDMNIITEEGTTYDISSIVTTTLGGYLTQDDMDEIITYAKGKSIDVVPSLDMPGHMSNILANYSDFRYNGKAWTLDCTNPSAVAFGLAIVEKFANYFSSRGCKYWNIGADEIVTANNASGYWKNVPSADIPYFIQFINKASEVVAKNGMIPRVFNDGVLYGADYANYFNRNIEVYSWCSATTEGDTNIQSAEVLRKNGFRLINTNKNWYFIVPTSNSRTSNTAVENANILKSFISGSLSTDQDGACICIWCDSDTTADGGNAALPSILADINSLGIGIGLTLPNLDYPAID